MTNNSARLNVREYVPLKDRTSFRVGGSARYFAEVISPAELQELFTFAEQKDLPVFILGGGSNLLVSDHGFDGLVISIATRGIKLLREDDSHVYVRVAAGEIWDDFVMHAVERGWWGIENMSLIPGTVGAVPIQNVGAYGQEAAQVIYEVEVLDTVSSQAVHLPADQCRFSYRRSIFNRELKGRYVVLSVSFRLGKSPLPNRTHEAVRSRVGISAGIGQMRDCIVRLREDGRLADTETLGNAGSFFQSPFVPEDDRRRIAAIWDARMSAEEAGKLLRRCYQTEEGFKVPAAALIQSAGMTDVSVGGAALYMKNPAILVNQTGEARATDVLELAQRVRQAVFEKSGLILSIEPEPVGFDPVELDQAMEVFS